MAKCRPPSRRTGRRKKSAAPIHAFPSSSAPLRGSNWSGSLRDFDLVLFADVVLATEPVFHRALQLRQRHAAAHFHQPVADGDGVIEDGVIGEVAHGEAVQPFQWTVFW